MIRLFLFLVATAFVRAQSLPDEVWVSKNLHWQKAPKEYNPHLSTTSAMVLYLRADGRFGMMYCRLNKGANYTVVSQGDGQDIYGGTWRDLGDKIEARYRLIERTVPKIGEKIPGAEVVTLVRKARARSTAVELEFDSNRLVAFGRELPPSEFSRFFHFPEQNQ
jgi:hypothetical protein